MHRSESLSHALSSTDLNAMDETLEEKNSKASEIIDPLTAFQQSNLKGTGKNECRK